MTISDYYYATVAYADIFSYPLTPDDIYFWFIGNVPPQTIRNRRVKGVVPVRGYQILKSRRSIIAVRRRRERIWKKKWKTARFAASLLRMFPTVQLVGVTGGLAMHNADRSDDVDVIVITSTGALWTTRFLCVLCLDIFGLRRKPSDGRVADKICLNMFLTLDSLALPTREQDLFAAHEVLQMEPLWSREDTYKKFLFQNSWVKKFLPVAWSIRKRGIVLHPKKNHWGTRVGVTLLKILELPMKFFELRYMQHRRTNEVIADGMLRFHPRDARVWVRQQLEKRLRRMNIPLDNIFYGR